MRLCGKGNEGWGLGLFLVMFPDEEDNTTTTKYFDKKKTLSSSNSFKSTTNSAHLFSRAQSTISICALLVFFTLVLFTLSNFDHNISSDSTTTTIVVTRRWLGEKGFKSNTKKYALQGMGTLYRRGTRAMSDLIVAHLNEELMDEDFVIFLRSLHLSGITSRADVVFIFSQQSNFSGLIQQENESFLKLFLNSTQVTGLDLTQFTKERSQGGEPIWGKKIRYNSSNSEGGEVLNDELNGLSYGSVVGFEVSELDPEKSLSGFLDHLPIRLRRWACYPMLLGRVRRNFKHIMLVDAKEVILLGDSLARVRQKGAESVHLWKNSEKTRAKSVTADAIMGGIRGIRWLSNAMLNEIVRAAIQRKNKNKSAVSDSVILSQLINNESLLKSLNIVTSTESPILSANSLVSINSSSSSSPSLSSLVMLHRDNNRNVDVNHILHREICSSLFVYRECYRTSIV